MDFASFVMLSAGTSATRPTGRKLIGVLAAPRLPFLNWGAAVCHCGATAALGELRGAVPSVAAAAVVALTALSARDLLLAHPRGKALGPGLRGRVWD